MHESLVLVLLTAPMLLFSVFARGLGRWNLTAPIIFVAVGVIVARVSGTSTEEFDWLRLLAELTLVLVLFCDAASVRPRQIERERGLVGRLLLIGLPLTILMGAAAAAIVFPGIPLAAAVLLAAILAPTDAALGAATVSDPRVPVRIRRVLNVESGLNDGLATPVVLFAIAALSMEESPAAGRSGVAALVEIAVGALAGAAIGYGSGWLLQRSTTAGWSSARSRTVAGLTAPFLAYATSLLVGGNGFIAAFVGGSFFALAVRPGTEEHVLDLAEGLSGPLGYATWMAFGAFLVPLLIDDLGWQEVVYALASLTVLRMLPVILALLGTGLRLPTQLFVGWFGPRGLASVVFSLIALESLPMTPVLASILGTAALTVLGSVVLHGITAGPGAGRYAAWIAAENPKAELQDSPIPSGRSTLTGTA